MSLSCLDIRYGSAWFAHREQRPMGAQNEGPEAVQLEISERQILVFPAQFLDLQADLILVHGLEHRYGESGPAI